MTDGASASVAANRIVRWIVPAWPAPVRVRASMTTRAGGVSVGPFGAPSGGGMNLGIGSGDDPESVAANRMLLARHLPSEPCWLRQVHGVHVVDAATARGDAVEADASFTDRPGVVCAVVVADCMPVLLCDRAGTRVAAAHAGWRGLVGGVLEATVGAAGLDPDATLAWIGPCIGAARFEVGDDVRDAFVAVAGATVERVDAAFVAHGRGKWLADLPALAAIRLAACGVRHVTRSGLCTVSDPARFYSYRRDGVTGRMAALVWLAD